ncbi:unnamed protein product, partial [Fusarium fujikuroi]
MIKSQSLLRNAPMRISSLGTSRNAFNRGREIPESRGPLDMQTWCANGYVTLSIPVFDALFLKCGCYEQDRSLGKVEMKEGFHRQSDIGDSNPMKHGDILSQGVSRLI